MRRPREASVSFLSIFCRCFLGFVSILHLFSVDVCLGCLWIFFSYSVCIMARVHRNQHKATLRLRIRPPQAVPLLVSSHLLNVPFIVSWLNVTVCNWMYTIIYKSMLMSKLDLEKCLSVFCRFSVDVSLGRLSSFRLFSVDVCLIFCRYSARILSVFNPYYDLCSQEPAQARSAPQDSSIHKQSHLLYRPTY